MNRFLLTVTIHCFATISFAQYDTLQIENISIFLDTSVAPEYFHVELNLTDYYNWKGKSTRKKANQFYVNIDSCEQQFNEQLRKIGVIPKNKTTHSDRLINSTWNTPQQNLRRISFDVSSSLEAKLVYDSIPEKGFKTVSISGKLYDSTKTKIMEELQSKALTACYQKAITSVKTQNYDSFCTYYINHNYNYAYDYNQTYALTTGPIGPRTIVYDDIILFTSLQFSYKALKKTSATTLKSE